ncbi:MAG TPA: FtsX-like permease family protein [Steroidobacteraceae bacterium]|jgi:putative ABC transport system permease protein|nr:FtsX-like permease family protein [Steroidobacteraceae bacterium]
MLRSYWTAAWRQLLHHPVYAAINIAGLAVGFAAAILIGLYLRDEFSYDRWIPGYRQVYRIALQLQFGNMQQAPSAGTAAPTAGWLKADFPQIIAAGRMQADTRVLRRADVQASETVYWADPELFDVLPLPARSGNPRLALESPDAIVLTAALARKYFGRTQVLGETMLLDGRYPLRVGAVLRDLPEETHLGARIFLSARSALSALPPIAAPLRAGAAFEALTRTLTYIRLRADADPEVLAAALPAMMLRHANVPRTPSGRPLFPLPIIRMQPLASLHFVPAGPHSMKTPSSLTADEAMGAVGVLILLIAGVNFINLLAAQSRRRAAEVGIRKTVGASAFDLWLQFFGESMLTVVIAMVVALALAEMLVPGLDAFLDRHIELRWWHDAQLGRAIVGLILALAALGGFQTAAALRSGTASPLRRAPVRQALVLLQFAILIGLVLTTAVVYRQVRFATRESLRFDIDEVLTIATDCRGAFADQVRMLPGVRSAACSGALIGTPGAGIQFVVARADGLQAPYSATILPLEPGLLELLELRPLAGRFFNAGHPADRAAAGGFWGTAGTVVINQTAVRRLGFSSAQAAIGHAVVLPGQKAFPLIIGVAPDFELEGVRHEIQPTFFRWLPEDRYLFVKLRGQRVPETLAAIDALWSNSEGARPIDRSFLNSDIQALYVDVTRESQIFAAFAAIAIFVASLGMLGLAIFTAEQRTKEIGVRRAVGASRADVLRLLLWQFSRPVLAANLIAWPVAGYLLSRWLRGFVYRIGLDWWMFFAAAAVALVVALSTVCVHALQVARARPVTALRYE